MLGSSSTNQITLFLRGAAIIYIFVISLYFIESKKGQQLWTGLQKLYFYCISKTRTITTIIFLPWTPEFISGVYGRKQFEEIQ